MYWINQVQNIIKEIETTEINIDILENQKRQLFKKAGGPLGLKSIEISGLPGGKGPKFNLQLLMEEIQEINDKIECEYMLLTDLKNTYDKYKEKLKNSNKLNCQIAYKRLVENKTYKEIAIDLRLSESYVRNSGNKLFKGIEK